jgi:hypothetical protein
LVSLTKIRFCKNRFLVGYKIDIYGDGISIFYYNICDILYHMSAFSNGNFDDSPSSISPWDKDITGTGTIAEVTTFVQSAPNAVKFTISAAGPTNAYLYQTFTTLPNTT